MRRESNEAGVLNAWFSKRKDGRSRKGRRERWEKTFHPFNIRLIIKLSTSQHKVCDL